MKERALSGAAHAESRERHRAEFLEEGAGRCLTSGGKGRGQHDGA